MSDSPDKKPTEPNPYESPQATNADGQNPKTRRSRIPLLSIAVILVPFAATIAGYITCWAAMLPVSVVVKGENYDLLFIAGVVGFILGSVVGGIGVVLLLRRFFD